MRTWKVEVCCVVLVAAFVAAFVCNVSAENQLLEQIQSSGIPLDENTSVKLAPPLLMGKQPSDVQRLLDQLAQRHGWERFSRNSPTSPVHVEVSYVQNAAEKRIGHNIYSAFVGYAPLATLKDQEIMSSLFGSSAEDKELMGFDPKSLPNEVLQKVGINSKDENVRYSTLRIPLMNRIVIEGTARIETIEKENFVIIAWELDPHFKIDSSKGQSSELAEYANRYRRVERDELGKEVESAPVAYSGCGGYLCVMQTGLAENQLLIESRMAMYEPDEWFAGSNFLRSKFPAALQESAQSFRRKMIANKPAK